MLTLIQRWHKQCPLGDKSDNNEGRRCVRGKPIGGWNLVDQFTRSWMVMIVQYLLCNAKVDLDPIQMMPVERWQQSRKGVWEKSTRG